jgi:hypothetical protein
VVDRWEILETFVSFIHAVCVGAEDIILAVLSRYSTRLLVEFFEGVCEVCSSPRKHGTNIEPETYSSSESL